MIWLNICVMARIKPARNPSGQVVFVHMSVECDARWRLKQTQRISSIFAAFYLTGAGAGYQGNWMNGGVIH